MRCGMVREVGRRLHWNESSQFLEHFQRKLRIAVVEPQALCELLKRHFHRREHDFYIPGGSDHVSVGESTAFQGLQKKQRNV